MFDSLLHKRLSDRHNPAIEREESRINKGNRKSLAENAVTCTRSRSTYVTTSNLEVVLEVDLKRHND